MDTENQTEARYPGELRGAQSKTARDYSQGNGCDLPCRPMTDEEIIAKMFSYVPPTPRTLPKFAAVNQAAKNFAEIVLANLPPCADRTAVINTIRMARMLANQGIALDGLSLY